MHVEIRNTNVSWMSLWSGDGGVASHDVRLGAGADYDEGNMCVDARMRMVSMNGLFAASETRECYQGQHVAGLLSIASCSLQH